MYSLQQLYGRIIWNFRDPRSGSTWFLYNLSLKLARTNYFFDIINPDIFGVYDDTYYINYDGQEKKKIVSDFFKNREQDPNDIYKILNTHEYSALKSINNYKNPILIRNLRKDKMGQFASLLVANHTKRYNVHSKNERNILPKIEPITVNEGSIRSFVERIKEAEQLWQTYALHYENESVYYEDLLTGWESNLFPLKLLMTDVDSTTSTNGSIMKQHRNLNVLPLPLKLPYNYREIITNYDYVDRIIKEELGD